MDDPVTVSVLTVDQIAGTDSGGDGHYVKVLTRWNNRLYLSYGSVNDNAGPIHVLYVDLDNPSSVVDEATLTTEETSQYRAFGGSLYAAFLDPRGGIANPENGAYAVKDGIDGEWVIAGTNLTPYGEHVYDLAVTEAGLFLCGLAETVDGDSLDYGQVWRTADDGATWTVEIPVLVDTVLGPWPWRLFDFTSGTIIVCGTDEHLYQWDGATWADTGADGFMSPTKGQNARRFTVNGTEIWFGYLAVLPDPVSAVDPGPFRDDDNWTPAYTAVSVDVSEDGLHMYVLDGLQNVYRYTQTGARTWLYSGIDNTARCIAVDEPNGLLYYGTTDSRVCAVALP